MKSNDIGSKIILIEAILGKRISNKNKFISIILSLKYDDTERINQIALALNIDFEEFLQDYKPYLNTNEVESLINRGFTIGSHSIDHPYFRLIDIKEQKRQILESTHFIESNFDLKDRYFSFPFSDDGVSKKLFKWLFEEQNFKLSFGVSGIKQDLFNCTYIAFLSKQMVIRQKTLLRQNICIICSSK